ncbi:MAG TPA: glucosidase [Candidatus Dormibacteraeota bacterium]|nr:glucosidase [Candidatus Dormibacteraeota bacterium]
MSDPWRRWGPYLSERAWGTVREDYSPGGTAWEYFPHDHARSRAYRWNEDGLAGICDEDQILCLALAFWNGVDPILKERIFGLTGNQGNHGEDAKEYWWYLDSTPTHSWMRWRYVYPQQPFPYSALVAVNASRTRADPEYELLDTGVLDAGYWDVEAQFAKASPEEMLVRVLVRNSGPQTATLHLLPTLWFRNRWAFEPGVARPVIAAEQDGSMTARDGVLGTRTLRTWPPAPVLACDNETNTARLWDVAGPPYPKDGINDHVVHGLPTVSPDRTGTKAAFHHVLTVEPGATAEIRLRLAETPGAPDALDTAAFDAVMAARRAEADAYHASLAPAGAGDDERTVLRQAHAGMLWSKQYYHLNVARWLDGDPGQPPPPPQRRSGRNARWRHLDNREVISMPDTWEYPWYASWDLAFHCVVLARVDAEFAKQQLILLCREWYMSPAGQLPAYEWSFDDVNPPLHAWAALHVFHTAGDEDYHFLERVFHKLLINFTWWVNRKDPDGTDIFAGGFLGLDNIGPFDRSAMLPPGAHLDQADATAWMAFYCLCMLELALVLARHDDTYEDVATKFFEHFVHIAGAINSRGLWDDEDGFYYDVLHQPDGTTVPIPARSLVGLIALCATTTLGHDTMQRLPAFAERLRWYIEHNADAMQAVSLDVDESRESRLLAIVGPERLRRMLAAMLDEDEFLSPHGLRALSRYHRDHPLDIQVDGATQRLDYEPGESTSGVFGGNSNWRGPVWFPTNFLLVEALRRYHAYLGDTFTVEHPSRSGQQRTLAEVADDLTDRLVSIFLRDAGGRRPLFGDDERFQQDPAFRDSLLFHEYFHGDTGAGLGASHQTGWTGLVAELLMRRTSRRPADRTRDTP